MRLETDFSRRIFILKKKEVIKLRTDYTDCIRTSMSVEEFFGRLKKFASRDHRNIFKEGILTNPKIRRVIEEYRKGRIRRITVFSIFGVTSGMIVLAYAEGYRTADIAKVFEATPRDVHRTVLYTLSLINPLSFIRIAPDGKEEKVI